MKELQAAEERRTAAQLEAAERPDDVDAQQRLRQAEEKVARKLAAYDSSPRGQSDLRSAIAAAADPSAIAVDELRTRLAIGRITRVDQKRALARSRGGSAVEESREADKALRRLRHPAPPAEISETPALGFYVLTDTGADRYTAASAARTAAIAAGAPNFYDAQTGDQVVLHRGER
ncbi:hypothetical protein ACH3VR_22115 [Microbacterium sp. B2969]|uniref:Uncharacterized protein n=2 Tax=Microbacterium alkaliflavum TaxID=3248839 RepID=A0ABW7QIE9_9MICO